MGILNLIFIRHGKTKSNLRKAYLGISEESLCAEGISELENNITMDRYKCALPVRKVYISPMLRCRQTADIIFPDIGYNEVDDFHEMNFGIFENKNYLDLQDDPEYNRWVDSMCTSKIPQGESLEEFTVRVNNAFRNLYPELRNLEDESNVAFVVHGGTIMAILSKLTGKDFYNFQIANGQGYILRCTIEEDCNVVNIKNLQEN